jgi:hypothetical protein
MEKRKIIWCLACYVWVAYANGPQLGGLGDPSMENGRIYVPGELCS